MSPIIATQTQILLAYVQASAKKRANEQVPCHSKGFASSLPSFPLSNKKEYKSSKLQNKLFKQNNTSQYCLYIE
jgi:hypothetical protein